MSQNPPDKIIVRTSQFPRDLLEKAYREIQESKKLSLTDFPKDVQDTVNAKLAKGASRNTKRKEDTNES